jgi:hypothetical protein
MSTSTMRDAGAIGPGFVRLNAESPRKKGVECLSAGGFVSLVDACRTIRSWRRDYERVRPHGSLGDLTPEKFASISTPTRKALAAAAF